jgi:hypothetical protein
LLALVATVVFSSCSGGGSTGDGGLTSGTGDRVYRNEVVAKLEMVAPASLEFLVRATLPVPPGTFRPGDGQVPLSLVSWPGHAAPTQVEAVTMYPNPADGASVVEVIARVKRSSKVAPGDTLPLYIAYKPHAGKDMRIKRNVKELLAAPGALRLSTQDVFGHVYSADLFSQVLNKDPRARMLRKGELATEYAVHEILRPTQPKGGAQGTLDHMMGVHAYVTTFDRESWFLLDLHVHNGMDGLDNSTQDDTALDELFFKNLLLDLPNGWKAEALFDHPSLGSGGPSGNHWSLALVKSLEGNKLHSLPKQGRFVRRLAVWADGSQQPAEAMLRGENMAYSRPGSAPNGAEYWSWWNRDTARWFPQAHRLPGLEHVGLDAVEAIVVGNCDAYEGRLATGKGANYPYISNALGWAQPWGVSYGGMTGSDEINLVDGFAELMVGRPEGYRLAQLTLRAYCDRQPTALFGSDGTPTRVEDIMVLEGYGAPYADGSFNLTPGSASDPYGFDDAPMFQIEAAEAQGKVPGYRDELDSWMPIDIQHYIRFTRNLKLLAWMANDSLAKDQLVAAAEIFRLGFHEHTNTSYGYIQYTGLRARMDHVLEFPGQGVDMSRAEGWGLDTAVAAYLVADEATRDRLYPWFETIAQLAEDGASTCTGNLMASNIGNKQFDGKYVIRYLGHSSYADNGLRGIQRSVLDSRDPARAERLGEVLVGNARALCTPPFWDEESGRPWNFLGVGPVDPAEGEFCFDLPADAFGPYTTNSRYFASLAYAYEETGDDLFLFRAAQMLGGGVLESRLEELGTSNLVTFSALLATVQEQPSQ